MSSDLHRLQNGSDIRGVALAVPGGRPVDLTEEACARVAAAFVRWLAQRTGKPAEQLKIGVGHDSRLTAEALTAAALRGIGAAGARAVDCGLASTPAMFMGTVFVETAFDGSVMLTASHLPKERNGMKFFTSEGGLDKPDITAVLDLAAVMEKFPAREEHWARTDLMGRYCAHLREKVIQGTNKGVYPLTGLHIVVDAGNGAGGFFVPVPGA